jgi:hypothetical protein
MLLRIKEENATFYSLKMTLEKKSNSQYIPVYKCEEYLWGKWPQLHQLFNMLLK